MYFEHLLCLTFLFYAIAQNDAINFKRIQNRIQNSVLRLYIFSSPKQVRKGISRQIKHVYNYINVVNLYVLDVNSKYYSLSDDERTIIETIISLSL